MNEFGYNIVEVSKDEMNENRESFNVVHCNECNTSYEMEGSTIVYHTSFPSFGLDRKTCCYCS